MRQPPPGLLSLLSCADDCACRVPTLLLQFSSCSPRMARWALVPLAISADRVAVCWPGCGPACLMAAVPLQQHSSSAFERITSAFHSVAILQNACIKCGAGTYTASGDGTGNTVCAKWCVTQALGFAAGCNTA